MTVTVPEAEVRCGPGKGFYVTSKLRQGEQVVVLRECKTDKNWLEIEPPAGSFSWIKSVFVKITRELPKCAIARVVADPDSPVAVLAGSNFHKEKPNVEAAKVSRGTQVVILDRNPNDPETLGWLPIEPTPQEVRYIPADAVNGSSPIRVVATQGPPSGATGPAADEFKAKLEQARRYYEQAARDPSLDPVQRQQAQIILQSLTGGQNLAAQQPGHPSNTAATQAQGQLVSRPPGGTPGQTTLYNAPAPSAPTVPATANQPRWSDWGLLRKTSFLRDGQAVYSLQNRQGLPMLYAVPERGKTLDPYVDRQVALYGSLIYPSDDNIRNYLMTVSYVAPPQ